MAKTHSVVGKIKVKERFLSVAKITVGTLLMLLLPKRRSKMEQLATIPWHSENQPDAIDRLIRVGLLWWSSRDKSGEQLANLHQQFWQQQSSQEYYAGTKGRFKKVFLPHFDCFLDDLKKLAIQQDLSTLIEVGCGDGQLLNHMQRRIALQRNIGLDLSEDQIAANRQAYSQQDLEYYGGDASHWICTHAPAHSLYVTGLGVLEYFTQAQLEQLLQSIATHRSPACAMFIEPIDPKADFDTFDASYPAGEEHSFTHNYPNRLLQAGWTVERLENVQLAPYRWLVIIATCC